MSQSWSDGEECLLSSLRGKPTYEDFTFLKLCPYVPSASRDGPTSSSSDRETYLDTLSTAHPKEERLRVNKGDILLF